MDASLQESVKLLDKHMDSLQEIETTAVVSQVIDIMFAFQKLHYCY